MVFLANLLTWTSFHTAALIFGKSDEKVHMIEVHTEGGGRAGENSRDSIVSRWKSAGRCQKPLSRVDGTSNKGVGILLKVKKTFLLS